MTLEEWIGTVFYGSAVLFALLEFWRPDRVATVDFIVRWRTNLILGVLQSGVGMLLVPVAAVAASTYAQAHAWGLSSFEPSLAPIAIGVLILDLIKYLEHRLLHEIPLLWRLHLAHHADLDVDFTTGLRHHPLEVAFSMLLTAGLILVVGISIQSVLIYALIAAATTFYTHANLMWPDWLDRALRSMFVTRDVHLVHHSMNPIETNSNYGIVLTLWDRMFRTYTESSRARTVTLGLDTIRDPAISGVFLTLKTPFIQLPPAETAAALRSELQPPAQSTKGDNHRCG